MKKLLLLIILFGLQGYGQKTFVVYNYTAYPVFITDITTSASGAYPEFSANFTSLDPIALNPGDSYMLQNNGHPYRFPFVSLIPNNTYFDTWFRRTSPTTATLVSNTAAWVLGSPQVFDRLSFYIYYPIDVSGTVGIASPNLSGPGWSATYTMLVDSINPNLITYMVVFM